MFDWIVPSFFMQSTTSTTKSSTSIRILDIQQLDDLYSLSHPFIKCPNTIAHLRKTKVMFLMRGLPGSGKSTLVNILKRIYSQSFVICSADNYFLDSQGVYNFNRDKIGEAHRVCQEHAEDACKNNVLAVIIDNTNIRMDECRPYFQKASTYGYIVIIVEPRTNWKRDANILNIRNTHQVPADVIEGRLRQYTPLIPFYFGLFLNQEQSNYVLQQAYGYYHQALQMFPQLRNDLEKVSRSKNIHVNNLLHRSNMTVQPKILHCTVKFIGKTTDQTRNEYSKYAGNRLVSHLLGKMCSGYIVGFAITPRARLLFTDRNVWSLWDQDDNETVTKNSTPTARNDNARGYGNKKQQQQQQNRGPRRNNKSKITTTDDDYDTSPMVRSVADDDVLLVDKVTPSNESEEMSFLHPTFGFLSRAHLTCGVGPGVSAVQTGQDMIDMIRKESDSLQRNTRVLDRDNEQMVMKYFGDGHCFVYLKEPIPVETIFTG
ncbi:unnamed protein product, partial [Adineta ricciae]